MIRILPSACLQNVGVPKQTFFRGSISRPVLSPVNASAGPSRGPPHDSEPVRFATPSLCDSFIHYALPVTRRFRKPEVNLVQEIPIPIVTQLTKTRPLHSKPPRQGSMIAMRFCDN